MLTKPSERKGLHIRAAFLVYLETTTIYTCGKLANHSVWDPWVQTPMDRVSSIFECVISKLCPYGKDPKKSNTYELSMSLWLSTASQ
jgi:hypothetical protein